MMGALDKWIKAFSISDRHTNWMIREGKGFKAEDLLNDVAGISAGDTCIDLGSGTGTFALPMAGLVGDNGRVYAVDGSSEMLAHLKAKNPPGNLFLSTAM
jgi:ubiquinone/menaquinone biosynthesis C-methylase UbiE